MGLYGWGHSCASDVELLDGHSRYGFLESKSRELRPDLFFGLSGAVAISLEGVRIWAYLHAFERSLPPSLPLSLHTPFHSHRARSRDEQQYTLFSGLGSLVVCGCFGPTTSLVISRSILAPDLLPRSWSTISDARPIFTRSSQRAEREMVVAFG
ncbi:hypothetical protein MPTK1_4g18330 [Marchantia polymorpha subsp. ruderalis]|uniref:Uncharacterized protein n=2 Tax=Marchantia polymorpha TaxID=3197 RepID=A0AAF6BB81_MARPO|nr:hypothetical protein MARPO_0041s0114 [Marchantia polymorpha]BBN09265.1 hypothetical protein Mp_4g18330 [Marchantia polymorpha subsp. ruderalis]|eukprot:PTQ40253.1 hypothetical protein MARPO_0041s0114 [Marchantia polymorpha]